MSLTPGWKFHCNAGAASDLWSLGCLLYELVTGRFLFHDPDWIRFFMRVTRDGGAVLPPERAVCTATLPDHRNQLLPPGS